MKFVLDIQNKFQNDDVNFRSTSSFLLSLMEEWICWEKEEAWAASLEKQLI